jgi:hypothetical protein
MKRTTIAIFGILLMATAVACSNVESSPSPVTTDGAHENVPSPLETVLAATYAPSSKPTVPPPVTPTGVSMTSLDPPAKCPATFGASCFKYKVAWSTPAVRGTNVEVYGVTKCLDQPDCVLPTTTITSANLVPLATVSSTNLSTTFLLGDGESYGAGWLVDATSKTQYVYGVVVRTMSSGGRSPFVVVWTW